MVYKYQGSTMSNAFKIKVVDMILKSIEQIWENKFNTQESSAFFLSGHYFRKI